MTRTALIDELVDNVILPYRTGDASTGQVRKAISGYLSSDFCAKALKSFHGPSIGASATASLYEGLRVTMIEEAPNGWASMLVRPGAGSSISTLATGGGSVSTPAAYNLVHILSAPGPLQVTRYAVEGYPKAGDLPGPMSLSIISKDLFSEGDFFAFEAGAQAVSVDGPINECEFLRFMGPEEHKLIFSFDTATTRFQSVSYANQSMTSEHLFLSLCTKMKSDGAFSHENEDLFRAFTKRASLNPDFNIFARWKALQVLAQMSTQDTGEVLERMAMSGLPNLAARAKSIIASRGERQGELR